MISSCAPDGDTHLLDMVCRLHEHVYDARKSRMSRKTFDAMCWWRADLALRFSALWQSSRKDVRWAAIGHLELGVTKGPKCRSRVIPAKYRHELMLEVRNAAGQGVRTPRQLLVGLTVAQSRGPSLRLTLRQRLALRGVKKHKSAAPTQTKPRSETHASPMCGYDFEYFEQYNYFCASRFEGLFNDVVGI